MSEVTPIIVADISWAESVPEWLYSQIREERMIDGMIEVLGKHTQTYEDLSDAEVLLYLLTASSMNPLDSHHANIHLYLTKKVMTHRLGADKIKEMDFLDVDKLSDYEETLLKDLKRHIWNCRGGKFKHPILSFLKEFQKEVKNDKQAKDNGIYAR